MGGRGRRQAGIGIPKYVHRSPLPERKTLGDTDNNTVETQTQDHHTGAARLIREHSAGIPYRAKGTIKSRVPGMNLKKNMKQLIL